MSSFNIRLRELRRSVDLSQNDFAKAIGLSKSSVNMYERGEREPSLATLEAIADFFNVDMDYLLGKSDCRNRYLASIGIVADNIIPMSATRELPLLGNIACGEPILAEENLDGTVSCPEHVAADFALRCKGDSMINARIFDGDIVYIRQQPSVDDGQIAAVLIGDEATLKRVRLYEDHISLEPENPQYRPIVLWGEEMASVRILGLAVAFTGPVQ